jgi:predicted flap endonuclease-1-like 5' DNA nuclease
MLSAKSSAPSPASANSFEINLPVSLSGEEQLSMSHPIADIAGIEQEMVTTLKSHGIRTTAKLLEAAKNPKGRKALAEKTGIDEKRLLCWANMADRMRIKGVGEEYASLLQAAGVDTVKELKYRNPARLAKAIAEANAKRKLVGVLPSDKAVVRWIEHAKKLPLKITY